MFFYLPRLATSKQQHFCPVSMPFFLELDVIVDLLVDSDTKVVRPSRSRKRPLVHGATVKTAEGHVIINSHIIAYFYQAAFNKMLVTKSPPHYVLIKLRTLTHTIHDGKYSHIHQI